VIDMGKKVTKKQLLEKLDKVDSYIRDTIESNAFAPVDVDAFLDNVLSLCVNMDRDCNIVWDPEYPSGYMNRSFIITDRGVDKLKMISSRRTYDK
jgi:hypothetical protein